MSGVTVPVSMLASNGKGGAIAAGVLGLLIVLVLAARRDPTVTSASSPNPPRW
jgi:hypothetical protein